MRSVLEAAWAGIDPERLARRTLDFLRIGSPTGEEREFSEHFASCLHSAGFTVEMDREYPHSPTVIGRHRFDTGPTLQFDGHTDTIDTPHDPPFLRDGIIFGRGACDMKGSLSAMVEAGIACMRAGLNLKGAMMITAHGLHEAPRGMNQPLDAMIRKGRIGSAAVIGECADRTVPVEGTGMCIFEITVKRDGEVLHETKGKGMPNPLFVSTEILAELKKKAEELARETSGKVRPSLFVGMVRGGDFYNRIPLECTIVGNRRFPHSIRYREVEEELREIASLGRNIGGITVDCKVTKIADGFWIPENAPLVRFLQAAYEDVTGLPLPADVTTICGNLPWFVRDGGIPAVYHGPVQDSAHADVERVTREELLRVTRVYIALAIRFLGA